MFYFAFRLCGSQLYNLDINLIKDVIIELDPTSKQLESNVDLPIKFHSFNSRIDYLVHNITRHRFSTYTLYALALYLVVALS